MNEADDLPDYRDPEYLRQHAKVADGELSMAALADRHGVATSTIEYWLDKHGLSGSMRKATRNIALTEPVKERLDAANREEETLSETVDRALDALEGEA